MGGHVVLRIKPRGFARKLNGDFAKIMNRADLLRQCAVTQVTGLVIGQFCIEFSRWRIRKNCRQLCCQLLAVAKQVGRLHPNGIAINAARQRNAVTINNVTAIWHIVCAGRTVSAAAFE